MGGGLGALLRFAVGRYAEFGPSAGFPWATFAVNLTGSMLLGYLFGVVTRRGDGALWWPFAGAGFCGGLTTFSTFDSEVVRLLEAGRPTVAAAYVIATVAVCVTGVVVGRWLGSRRY